MAFEPKIILEKTRRLAHPILEGSSKLRSETEMRVLHDKVNKAIDAINEIQDYLKSNT